MNSNLNALIPGLANHRILILGDVLLDEYVTGRAERMSREAPIPVLEFESRRYIPGGAANPASNIVALGSQAIQIGIVGDDQTAQQLRAELIHRKIDVSALVTVPDKPTTLKTRILAQMGLRFPQQVARIDTLSRDPISTETEAQIITQLSKYIDQSKALLISDYHNGLLTDSVIEAARKATQTANAPTFVDAQGKLEKYHGFGVVKCNADDASMYLSRPLIDDADFEAAASMLYEELGLTQAMVITRGGQGASIAESKASYTVPAPRISAVYDTVGAGDTWIAVLTLASVAGANIKDAVLLANLASGIVVQHVGNYAPSPEELSEASRK